MIRFEWQAKPDSPRSNADAGASKEMEKGEKEAEQEGHGAWQDIGFRVYVDTLSS